MERDYSIEIGKRIAKLRKERGMTQEQLAEITGITRPHISRIESGKHSVGVDILGLIAEALKADIDLIPRE